MGLGSIDKFKLNTGIEEPGRKPEIYPGFLPVNEQWSYTDGVVYKHFHKYGFTNVVFSRNMLNNSSYKYQDNVEIESKI